MRVLIIGSLAGLVFGTQARRHKRKEIRGGSLDSARMRAGE